jgi:hypothetical protein
MGFVARNYAWLLLGAAVLGLLAAFNLAVEVGAYATR